MTKAWNAAKKNIDYLFSSGDTHVSEENARITVPNPPKNNSYKTVILRSYGSV